MTTFRVIEGGRTEAGAMCRPSDADNANLRARVHRAEEDARKIAELMAPPSRRSAKPKTISCK